MAPKAHKPADSGVTVGNGARSCSLHEVTLNTFKQTPSGAFCRLPPLLPQSPWAFFSVRRSGGRSALQAL